MYSLLESAASSPPWVFTLFQVAVTTSAIRIFQKLSNPNLPLHRLIEEFLSVIQTIALSHECGVLRRSYGDVVYCVAIFLACQLYSKLFSRHVVTNPAGTVHRYVYERQMTDLELLEHTAIQFAGAWVAYKYVYYLWATPYADTFHKQQLASLNPCRSFITVSLTNAVLIEIALTFAFRLVAHGERHLPQYGSALIGLAAVGCTMAGLPYTGGFYNPTLAFSMQYNCSGHDNLEFFLVFLVGPLIASCFVGLYGDSIWRRLTPRDPDTSQ